MASPSSPSLDSARSAAGLPPPDGGRRSQPEHLLALAPSRAVLALAGPTTIVMLVGAVSNVLYTYYVSRLGADAIAAVSLVFPIVLVAMTAMGGGIGAGVSSVIARALGARRKAAAAAAAEHALVLALAFGVAFALAVGLGGRAIFSWMGGVGPVLDQATTFARVLFGGATITFLGAMLDSILRGEGNVRVAATWSTASLALQIALTPAFMFGLDLGLPGAAAAMLTSQFLATIPRALHVLRGRGIVHPRAWPRPISLAPLREILSVGIPASLSTTIYNVGSMVLTGVVARLGVDDLAAFGLGMRLDFLLSSFGYGLAAAVLTLVGLVSGAGRPELASTYVAAAGRMTVALLGVVAAVLWWWPSLWMGIFTTDSGVLEVGSLYLRIIGPSYPFIGLSMVLGFAFQGLGHATIPLAVMVLRIPLVLASVLLCTRVLALGEAGVFACIAAGNVLSACVLALLFRRATAAIAR